MRKRVWLEHRPSLRKGTRETDVNQRQGANRRRFIIIIIVSTWYLILKGSKISKKKTDSRVTENVPADRLLKRSTATDVRRYKYSGPRRFAENNMNLFYVEGMHTSSCQPVDVPRSQV